MRTPPARLKEVNSSYTWKPPTPYVIEVAKRVFHPKRKEKALHELLETYAERVSSKQEFFLGLVGDRREPTMDRIIQLHEKGDLLYQLPQKCPYEDSFVDLLVHSCSEIESVSVFVKECIVADPSGSIKDVASSIKIPGPSATRRRNGRLKALSTIAESLVSSRT